MHEDNRAILGDRYLEIFVDTPLAVYQRRGPKGLYAKAARGEIAHFTGLDSPFDPPLRPHLTVGTAGSGKNSTDFILNALGLPFLRRG